jgi:hypothetical protein
MLFTKVVFRMHMVTFCDDDFFFLSVIFAYPSALSLPKGVRDDPFNIEC